MKAAQIIDIVGSAIAHTMRTRGFEATKGTVESVIGEVAQYDTYGRSDLLWVSEIRKHYRPYDEASKAKFDSPEWKTYYKENRKWWNWVKRVQARALDSLRIC